MEVSVVIPLYNGEPWIEATLRSVLAQTHRPCEIVVVDDGSTDTSPALVRDTFPQVELLHRPGEGGRGAGPARRFGLQHTSAPLVAFLDQDDLWHPEHLRVLTGLLREHERYPAAVAGLDHFQAPSSPRYDVQPDDVWPFTPWDRYPLNSIHSPSCVLVRRRALERIGGWPERFAISDIHAWFKLTAATPMLRTRKITAGKRNHGGNHLQTLRTEKALFYLRERIRVCEDALAFRKEVTSEPADVFQERLNAFKAIGGVLEGALRGEMQLLADAARFLERKGRIEPKIGEPLWDFVFWMLRPQISAATPSQQRLILERIICGWPNRWSENQVRSMLARRLAQTISPYGFLSCALRRPLQMLTSLLFLQCVKTQVQDRVSRQLRAVLTV